MADLAKLVVKLEAESSKLRTELEKSNRKLDKFGKKTDSVVKGAKKAFGGLAFLVAGLSFKSMVDDAVKAASEIGNLSTRLGGSVEEWSRIKHASEEADVGFQVVAMAAQRSTRRIAEAAKGTGEAVGALNELGLSASKLKDLTPVEQMHVLADALKGVEGHSDKVRIAMKLFDSEGVRVLQMLQGGSAGLRAYAEEADRMGKTLTREGVDKMLKLEKAQKDMASSGVALSNTLAVALGPTIAEIANWLSSKVPKAAEFAIEGFRALRHFALEIVQKVADGLAGFYDMLAHLPGDLGRTYAHAAEKVRSFSAGIEETQRSLALAAGDMGKFETATGKAVYTLDQLAGSNDTVSEASKRSNEALREANKLMQERQRLIDSVMTPQEKYNDQLLQLNLLRERLANTPNPLTNETYLRAVDKYGKELEDALKAENKLNDATRELGMTFSSAFEEAVMNGGKLSDVLKGLAKDVAQIAIRNAETKPLANSVSGWFDDLFSGLGFADGGRPPVGQASWVGERGPELFVPDTAGTIVPTNAIGGISLSVSIGNIDASGSSNPMETQKAVQQGVSVAINQAIAKMRDMRARGELPEFG